jgi:hypothetical protein
LLIGGARWDAQGWRRWGSPASTTSSAGLFRLRQFENQGNGAFVERHESFRRRQWGPYGGRKEQKGENRRMHGNRKPSITAKLTPAFQGTKKRWNCGFAGIQDHRQVRRTTMRQTFGSRGNRRLE